MKKQTFKMERLDNILLRRLDQLTNEDGDFVYPSEGTDVGGTGSNLRQLLAYTFGKGKEKPIDYDIFCDYLEKIWKIPRSVMYKRIK